jgi:hypothetical protein
MAIHCHCSDHAAGFFSLQEAAFHQIELFREQLEAWILWY